MNMRRASRSIVPTALGAAGRLAVVARIAVLATGIAPVAGCLDDQLDPTRMGSTSNFIAFDTSFKPFMSWKRTQVGDAAVIGGHAAGPRFAYVSGEPSGGKFPVGTMIVKTVELGDPSTWTIHARAKRGPGTNESGAIEWEWFELSLATGSVSIDWRGDTPPAGHGYESLPGLGSTSSTDADCNSCHALSPATDYILSPALQAQLAAAP